MPKRCDKLSFFAKSANKAPGKGAHDWLREPDAYANLAKLDGWRHELCTSHVSKFWWNGSEWRSIEQAFQATDKSLKMMLGISSAKYDQTPSSSAVLAATADAQLWHIVPFGPPRRFWHLEQIRTAMRTRATQDDVSSDDDECFYIRGFKQ